MWSPHHGLPRARSAPAPERRAARVPGGAGTVGTPARPATTRTPEGRPLARAVCFVQCPFPRCSIRSPNLRDREVAPASCATRPTIEGSCSLRQRRSGRVGGASIQRPVSLSTGPPHTSVSPVDASDATPTARPVSRQVRDTLSRRSDRCNAPQGSRGRAGTSKRRRELWQKLAQPRASRWSQSGAQRPLHATTLEPRRSPLARVAFDLCRAEDPAAAAHNAPTCAELSRPRRTSWPARPLRNDAPVATLAVIDRCPSGHRATDRDHDRDLSGPRAFLPCASSPFGGQRPVLQPARRRPGRRASHRQGRPRRVPRYANLKGREGREQRLPALELEYRPSCTSSAFRSV